MPGAMTGPWWAPSDYEERLSMTEAQERALEAAELEERCDAHERDFDPDLDWDDG
jgi:hypothetical protein